MLRVVLIVILAVAAAATCPARVGAQTPSPGEESYAELVAANCVVLSRAESNRLVRFATAFSSCLAKRGVPVGPLQPAKTKITMAILRSTDRGRLVRAGVGCGNALGLDPEVASS
jgi:hypothetical protein